MLFRAWSGSSPLLDKMHSPSPRSRLVTEGPHEIGKGTFRLLLTFWISGCPFLEFWWIALAKWRGWRFQFQPSGPQLKPSREWSSAPFPALPALYLQDAHRFPISDPIPFPILFVRLAKHAVVGYGALDAGSGPKPPRSCPEESPATWWKQNVQSATLIMMLASVLSLLFILGPLRSAPCVTPEMEGAVPRQKLRVQRVRIRVLLRARSGCMAPKVPKEAEAAPQDDDVDAPQP